MNHLGTRIEAGAGGHAVSVPYASSRDAQRTCVIAFITAMSICARPAILKDELLQPEQMSMIKWLGLSVGEFKN